ncbi:hypothetical protein [Aquabacter cavernae]|uniref:hypothetical protein n=1 Tax=Aquabacter cavernae TaxID=2496029 RepID=UPI000F8DF951|nr:hypothetical protein [Aquabacter cavernae]
MAVIRVQASRFKRRVSFATVACVGSVATGCLFAERVEAQVVGVTLGTPFRSTESGRAMAGVSPFYDMAAEPTLAPGIMTLEALEESLKARGFTSISNLNRRGGAYVCEATGPRRERVRLVVDAASGEISGVQVIGFAGKRY